MLNVASMGVQVRRLSDSVRRPIFVKIQKPESFIQHFNREFGRRVERLTDAAAERLRGHAWPGNVRELRNVIERAMLFAEGTEIADSELLLDSGYKPRTAAIPQTTPQQGRRSRSMVEPRRRSRMCCRLAMGVGQVRYGRGGVGGC